jgi:hypothetical protein
MVAMTQDQKISCGSNYINSPALPNHCSPRIFSCDDFAWTHRGKIHHGSQPGEVKGEVDESANFHSQAWRLLGTCKTVRTHGHLSWPFSTFSIESLPNFPIYRHGPSATSGLIRRRNLGGLTLLNRFWRSWRRMHRLRRTPTSGESTVSSLRISKHPKTAWHNFWPTA